MENLEHVVEVGNEALALFVRFWLTASPSLPEAGSAAAQAKGKDRYESFVRALARRLDSNERLGR